jgi:hypothetical protein
VHDLIVEGRRNLVHPGIIRILLETHHHQDFGVEFGLVVGDGFLAR